MLASQTVVWRMAYRSSPWTNARAPQPVENRELAAAHSQHRDPYRSWWHEHHFSALGDRTLMHDRVYYAPPLRFGRAPAEPASVELAGEGVQATV